jgi:hypothetical protein
MKKNIQMLVTRKYENDDIEINDIISNDIIKDEFKYKYIGIPIKYIFDYMQDMIYDIYSNIHIYIIIICAVILFLIFIKNILLKIKII